MIEAGIECPATIIFVPPASNGDEECFRENLSDSPRRFVPIDPRQTNVEANDVGFHPSSDFYCLVSIIGHGGIQPFGFEKECKSVCGGLRVIQNKDPATVGDLLTNLLNVK